MDSTVHGETGQSVQQHAEEENRLEQGSVTTLPLLTVVKIVLDMRKKLKSATNSLAGLDVHGEVMSLVMRIGAALMAVQGATVGPSAMVRSIFSGGIL